MKKTLFLLFVLASGCTQQRIIMREKVVERNAPFKPASRADNFIYNQATGSADVLFVLDDTESAQGVINHFEKTYRKLIKRLEGQEFSPLSLVTQSVTTPYPVIPGNPFKAGENSALHLRDLFEGRVEGSQKIPPVWNQDQQGYLLPFESMIDGLTHASLKDRMRVPLFLVLLMGDRADLGSKFFSDPETWKQFLGALELSRGFYQTHLTLLAKQNANQPARRYPFCHVFFPPEETVLQLKKAPWRSFTAVDLCDADWENFGDELASKILAFKGRYVLTHRPEQPEAMVVRSPRTSLRMGQHFTFDADANEILFLPGHPFQDGELFSVSYFLELPPEEISGVTPPGGASPRP